MQSELIKILKERGYFYQCTDETNLNKLLLKEKTPIYIGFDCTAAALHVGHLMQIMLLRIVQKLGYKPIILLGGATTKIGDPSGKDKIRQMLTDKQIEENLKSIYNNLLQFISFDNKKHKNPAILVNNNDWLKDKNYIDFLQEIGPFFSVNQMLLYESVKMRLERKQSLSFLEFNYMILQAYDFVQLNRQYGCRLQLSGSDQWGNIINGIELNRKINTESGELYGLTTPLLTTSNGKKMGKTEKGAVWLDKNLCSSYEYYQFWRNVSDDDVIRFLKLFTELPLGEIEKLSDLQGIDLNYAKKILAFEATKICHGETEAKKVDTASSEMFEQGVLSANCPAYNLVDKFDYTNINRIANEIEYQEYADNNQYIKLTDIICDNNFAPSKAEAKRLIKSNAAKLNRVQITDINYNVEWVQNLYYIIKLLNNLIGHYKTLHQDAVQTEEFKQYNILIDDFVNIYQINFKNFIINEREMQHHMNDKSNEIPRKNIIVSSNDMAEKRYFILDKSLEHDNIKKLPKWLNAMSVKLDEIEQSFVKIHNRYKLNQYYKYSLSYSDNKNIKYLAIFCEGIYQIIHSLKLSVGKKKHVILLCKLDNVNFD